MYISFEFENIVHKVLHGDAELELDKDIKIVNNGGNVSLVMKQNYYVRINDRNIDYCDNLYLGKLTNRSLKLDTIYKKGSMKKIEISDYYIADTPKKKSSKVIVFGQNRL